MVVLDEILVDALCHIPLNSRGHREDNRESDDYTKRVLRAVKMKI